MFQAYDINDISFTPIHFATPTGDKVGTMYGVRVLAARSFYYDKSTNRHFIIHVKDGMCGTEKTAIYFDIPPSNVVTINGEQYNVKFGGALTGSGTP